MSNLRRVICEKLQQIKPLKNVYNQLEVPAKKELFDAGRPALQWTIPKNVAQQDQKNLIDAFQSLNFDKQYIENVHLQPAAGRNAAKIVFKLQPDAFVAHTLQRHESRLASMEQEYANQHVLLDFSSPNIAKPFHVGHLRSTIIGNVLANLHQHLGYRTTKLNYLGDWGTQFGMLALGVQLANVDDATMRAKPIETLYQAYVEANRAAEHDPTLAQRARDIFAQLEAGSDTQMTQQWQQYRQYTVDELSQVYARLGVHFDQYEWESQYSQRDIGAVLEKLRQVGLLLREQDGREIVQIGERRVPVIKSDGSTLYLARDIAAILARYHKFKFTHAIYVVDNAQTDHFKALFKTANALEHNLSEQQLVHVKFGRIHGMSTRQGKAIFLSDVLDEARDIMREKRLQSATTKSNTNLDDHHVCDILGVSAVIINDLKQRRQRDYEFNWQQALQMNGDTGIKLQYTHCRLHSLLENFAGIDMNSIQPCWQLLAETEAQDLCYEIARFEQNVWNAKTQLEACVLVNYLFGLCNSTSRALKRLPVKHESNTAKQQQRLLLFNAAKRALQQGMLILGLQPLNQM